jgi:oligoribonuclease
VRADRLRDRRLLVVCAEPMPEPKRNPIVWLDMEMTGLDPRICVPLQVAVVLTDGDLKELDVMEATIWQPDSALETMEPFVRDMHTTNGLLEQVRASKLSVAQVEQQMLGLLTQHCDYRKGILAGSSIHQDRKFLDAYFPTFSNFLHYRMIDVSSVKELVKTWYGPEYTYSKSDEAAHTALADIRESIAELQHYRQAYFVSL